jgi:hypothetical protein
VYRVTGRLHNGRRVASYTLTPGAETYEHADSVEEICCLDEKYDRGWVIVREHLSCRDANNYAAGLLDMSARKTTLYDVSHSYQRGFFTLIHRKPDKGSPDRLMTFIVPRLMRGTMTDTFVVCYPDGRIERDPGLKAVSQMK